jgi:hypothetical protein
MSMNPCPGCLGFSIWRTSKVGDGATWAAAIRWMRRTSSSLRGDARCCGGAGLVVFGDAEQEQAARGVGHRGDVASEVALFLVALAVQLGFVLKVVGLWHRHSDKVRDVGVRDLVQPGVEQPFQASRAESDHGHASCLRR